MSGRYSLAALREDDRRRRLATVAAVVVGVSLTWFHWLGLLVAGALVALPQRTTRRGVGVSVAFGGLVVLGFLAELGLDQALDSFAGLGPLALLPVALGIALPVFGALARAII
ncbi:hypothetical protein [Haloarchaeobius sp. HME9146]|uniref:hypothetical protein n=1 Tax=Haloarchaeobius sp. HME9146 TaxID=2978732 RepID=UPI0021C002E0|nr:hypothetical protein [Haloarchaeobius sp. HME9146]MCT9096690.1 hypothetical protein [Haloarchaeobius sp. HME9146]